MNKEYDNIEYVLNHVDSQMICFHDWTKWKITGGQGFQRRHCKKCGKIQQVAL